MIIKIKKRDLWITTALLLVLISVPIIYAQVGTIKRAGIGVWLVIGNQNPTVKLINATNFSLDPVSGSSSAIIIVFNATDPDTVEQINGTTGGRALVNITLGGPGGQHRAQTTCSNTTTGSGATGVVQFTCTVNLKYYDNASSNWVINVSVTDSNSGVGRNDSNGSTNKFTFNALAAFSLVARDVSEGANLNFSSLNLNDQNAAAKAPILLNNTGNNDFDQLNITGAALIGLTTPSETIAASSFFVNTTNATAGAGMPLSNLAQTIPGINVNTNAQLLHGPGASGDSVPYSGPTITSGNQTLIFWVDVPGSGLSAQTYNNTWNLTVVDLS